jgi:hypothetical protein
VLYRVTDPTKKASATNASTWGTFEGALVVYDAGEVDGIGYVFSADDPYTGVDLDDCIEGGVLHAKAAEVVAFLDSYTEISPSGAGVHVLVKGVKSGSRCRTSKTLWGGEFEVCDRARFFCVTGNHMEGTPRTVEERQMELEEVVGWLLPTAIKPTAIKVAEESPPGQTFEEPATPTKHLIPDRGIIRDWIDLYGPLSEAPDEAHLGAAVATLSATVGWRAHVQWSENAEPATLNVVLEGPSAQARKTTTAETAHTLAREALQDVPEDERRLRVRSIGHTSDRGLLELVAPPTPEIAAEWEATPPPGVLLVWDEFGNVLGRPGDPKSADWLGKVRTTLMSMTNGRHGGMQTGASKAPPSRCAVSVLATMTRHELLDRVSSGLLRDGFMGRFVLIPHPGRSRLLPIPPRWTPEMIERRQEIVTWLRRLAQAEEVIGDVFKRMTPAAIKAREQWYREWVEKLDRDARGGSEIAGDAAVAFARLQTTAVKVATILAVSEWTPDRRLSDIEIDERHVEYGQELALLALREVVDLARAGGQQPADVFANKVATLLEKHGKTPMRQVLNGVRPPSGLSRDQCRAIVRGRHGDQWNVYTIVKGGPEIVELRAKEAA